MRFAKTFLAALLLPLILITAAAAQDAAEPPALPERVTAPDVTTEELTLRLVPLTRAELAAAAERWRDLVKARTQAVVDAQIAVNASSGALADAARQNLVQLTALRNDLFAKFNVVVDALEKKGGDPALISEYRQWRSSIVVEETRTADTQTLAKQALAWLTSPKGGIALGIDIAVVAASFLGLLFVARIIRAAARRWIGRVPNLSKLLQSFLVMVVYWLVMAFGLMIVLSALGIDITPVFALVGGASFILAFAFQETLGNLAAGLMIMINRPFDEGDFVDVGGTAGTVKAVSVVATTVTTPDNQVIVIPNSKVWGNIITNVTTSPQRRVDLTFGIAYEDSIEEAQAVLEKVVGAHPLILKDPAPTIRVHALGESSVDFIVRPWVRGGDYWPVYWDLTRQVKEAFDAAGISIPYPQRDVHIRGGHAAAPAGGGAISPGETVSHGTRPVAGFEETAEGSVEGGEAERDG